MALILTIRTGEEIEIGGDMGDGPTLFDRFGKPVRITICQIGVKGNQVRQAITAPKIVPVHRGEIYERIQREREAKVNGDVAQPDEAHA